MALPLHNANIELRNYTLTMDIKTFYTCSYDLFGMVAGLVVGMLLLNNNDIFIYELDSKRSGVKVKGDI